MILSKIDHVALSVSNLQRSIDFYRNLLGAEVIRILECDPESLLGKVVGMPGCRARIAHCQIGDTMLELFEYVSPSGKPVDEHSLQADKGWIHLGITSDDVNTDYARLKEKGVAFLSEPVEFRPGVWIVYFRGPDKEVCELRQTPPGDSDTHNESQ
ncbi:MAG: hypothetical protein GF398_09910 [Chitinivibrionales bacterium]|nr:hypothetical protein [Chitinivibrionales bacterium]